MPSAGETYVDSTQQEWTVIAEANGWVWLRSITLNNDEENKLLSSIEFANHNLSLTTNRDPVNHFNVRHDVELVDSVNEPRISIDFAAHTHTIGVARARNLMLHLMARVDPEWRHVNRAFRNWLSEITPEDDGITG